MAADTKARMVNAARDLLLQKGVEATSVDDVLQATKTGKSQFYHYFKSKAGMVTEALDAMLREAFFPVITSWEGVQPWLTSLAGMGKNGHPLALLALTIPPEERAAFPALAAYYDALRAPLLSFLEIEQKEGRLHAQIGCRELADLALTGMVGSTICSLTGAVDSRALASRNAHHLTLYLKAYARV